MGSIIRFTGTVFYSLLYINTRQGFYGLKYVYSVISGIENSLPGNPPNPINHVYSLPDKYISKKYFTYRLIQIFKIMFWGFIFKNPTKILSSAQDHALLHLLINTFFFFISGRNLPVRNDLYHSCTSFEGASWSGQPLNIFTWFIGSGGLKSWTATVRLVPAQLLTNRFQRSIPDF